MTPPLVCPQCGAPPREDGQGCRARFEELLALDHSRREPWGSRHGLVFAAYALQHPEDFSREVLERSWLALHRVYTHGDEPARVFAALRSGPPVSLKEWGVPALPEVFGFRRTPDLTVADLDPHRVDGYPDRVDRWCRSALSRWLEQPTTR